MVVRTPRALPLLALGGFVSLLVLVATGWGPVQRIDGAVSEAARAYGREHPGVIAFLRVATDLAATLPYVGFGAALTLVFALRRQRPRALFCAAVTVVVPTLWGLAHWLLHRPRPEDGFVAVASNGFPSGHTSNAVAGAVAAVLLLWPVLARTGRVVTLLVAAVFALFIGATRVALLAHWPTDVLGGGLLALTVVPLLARAGRARFPAGPDA